MVERRIERRVCLALPVRVLRAGRDVEAEMVDATCRGLYVRMPITPKVRHLERLSIDLPDRTIRVWAEVMRIVDERPGWVGVGLRFFALHGEERHAWESFVVHSGRVPYARAS